MPGERTPDTTPPNFKGSSDDEISLREHLQRQLDSQAEAIHRRISDLSRLLDERYARQEQALGIALAAIEKRFDAVNEFRGQLNDQSHTFMPRTESISRHERTQEQLEKMEQRMAVDIAGINRRLDIMQGQIQGAKESKVDMRAWVALGVTLIVAAITVVGFIIANSNGG